MIASRTLEDSPVTLDAAITRAKNIEIGNKFLLASFNNLNNDQGLNIVKPSSSKTPIDNKVTNDEMDSLAKQLEELKIAKMEKEIRELR